MAPADDDLDDTVPGSARPRAAVPRPDPVDDLEDTVTLVRASTARPPAAAVPDAPPAPPVVTPPRAPVPPVPVPLVELIEPRRPAARPVEPLFADTRDVTRPIAPAPSSVPPTAPPVPPTAAPITGNVWSQPLPSRPRPFRLRLDDGTLVPLDQPVYLGRKPSVPRIHPGGTPLLVTLDSPMHEVSSTHLELTTVGGTIVASDMRSTNGSVLRMPGAAPRILLGGESVVVTPGTVIELGDGNRIELLEPDPDAAWPAAGGALR